MNMEESPSGSETSLGDDLTTPDHHRDGSELSSDDGLDHRGSARISGGLSDPISIPKQQHKLAAAIRQRWEQAEKHYSNEYAELFRSTFSETVGDCGALAADFSPSQIGVVLWTAEEKQKLYTSISRKGRLDILGLAQAIDSKSQLEVLDYLQFLQQEETDKHIFGQELQNISHADLPAATEISQECETALELAADALAAKQDQFDVAALCLNGKEAWVVDRDTAGSLDARADEEGYLSDVEDDTGPSSARMFDLSNFISLSERVFMNAGGTAIESNWRHIAGKGGRPGLMVTVLDDFHNLVTSLTRRIMQSSLFLAQSRIRSLGFSGYAIRSVVKRQDVAAALEILGMSQNSWSYWVAVPRRNQLHVISGTHDRGETSKRLTYDSLEAALAVRSRHYRKSQSMTTEDEGQDTETNLGTSSDKDDDLMQTREASEAESPPPRHGSGSVSLDSTTDEEAPGTDDSAFQAMSSSRKRKQIQLDDKHDRWLEQLDSAMSQREEALLWDILGGDMATGKRDEQVSVPPDTGMQVVPEAHDAVQHRTRPYEAEWEHFGTMVAQNNFTEMEQQRKRRKVEPPDTKEMASKELPLR